LTSKMTNDRENEIIQKSIDILRKYLHPSKIIFFGSRAKGAASHGSDFDFAVDIQKPDQHTQRTIAAQLEKIAGLYKVDVIFLKSVDADFKKIVLKTGKIVYEG
jgi:uncharacterized protein